MHHDKALYKCTLLYLLEAGQIVSFVYFTAVKDIQEVNKLTCWIKLEQLDRCGQIGSTQTSQIELGQSDQCGQVGSTISRLDQVQSVRSTRISSINLDELDINSLKKPITNLSPLSLRLSYINLLHIRSISVIRHLTADLITGYLHRMQ